MRRIHRGLAVIVVLAGLQVSACAQKADTPSQVKPSKVEKVPGTDLKRVTLSTKAAERLDIKTVPAQNEQPGSRKRLARAEVVAKPAAAGQRASVLALPGEANGKGGTMARAVQVGAQDVAAPLSTPDSTAGLAPGQRVRVNPPLSGAGTRTVVPYGAVLYDAQGKTWVYTNPEALVFVRHSISVEYIDGDRVVLSDGPASGTMVVTIGAAELFGTELGGK